MRFYKFRPLFFHPRRCLWEAFQGFPQWKNLSIPRGNIGGRKRCKIPYLNHREVKDTPLSFPIRPAIRPEKKAVCAAFARELSYFQQSGRSSAWLERYVRDVEVARSNRVAPIFRFFIFLFFSLKQIVFNSFCVMADFFV